MSHSSQRQYIDELLRHYPGSVYWKDKEGRYLGCSPWIAELLGFKCVDDLLGKRDTDFLPSTVYEKFRMHDCEVMAFQAPRFYNEMVNILDGRPIWVPTMKMPLFSDEGEVIGIIGVVGQLEDIKTYEKFESRLKEINVKLRASNKQAATYFKSIIASLPGSVYWKDKHGVYLGCNQLVADRAGFNSPEEIIGKTDYDLSWGGTVSNHIENDRHVIQTKQAHTFEEVVTQPDGSQSTFFVTKAPLFNEFGEVVGVIGNSLDISIRKKYEERISAERKRAEAAIAAKMQFLENVAHDVRTPINGLLNTAQSLRKYIKEGDPAERDLDNLLSAAHGLARLLNEVLEFSIQGSSIYKTYEKPFNFEALIVKLFKLLRASAETKGLELSYDYNAELPSVIVSNPQWLHRILLSLLSNAIKYTRHGHVKLYVRALKPSEGKTVFLKLIVEDTGIGIPPEKESVIFEPFERLSPAYKGEYQGLGLGLTMVKRLVEQMGGSVYVSSVLGEGSRFSCELSVRQALGADEPEYKDFRSLNLEASIQEIKQSIKKPSDALGTFKSLGTVSEQLEHNNYKSDEESTTSETAIISAQKQVLLVEDVPLMQVVTKNILNELGFKTVVVSSGEEAILAYERARYRLVLLDIGLPDFSGIIVSKAIRALNQAKGLNTPVMALTAHLYPEKERECIDAGMVTVLKKPLDKDGLEQALDYYLNIKSEKGES